MNMLLKAALVWIVAAQWPFFPTPGVPKMPDGKPDLTAPAPRTSDGKPDLSGIWGRAAAPGQRGTPGAAPAATPAVGPDGIPNASFRDVGSGFKDGLPLQPWARELVKARMADNSKDNPDAHCLPMGFMQFHTHGQPRKIIQTPAVIVIIYEPNSGLRQIFTDGRVLPGKDVEPWWYGYSVGKWEGDTLVVETVNLIVASKLRQEEREAVANYLGIPGGTGLPPAAAYCADRAVKLPGNGNTEWNGWSPASNNDRFQPADRAGLTLDQVSRLKPRWV